MPRIVILSLVADSLLTSAAAVRSDDCLADPFPDYRPIVGWPQLPPKLELGPVSAVATDANDRVYVAHRGPQPILGFEGEGEFNLPHAVCLDAKGRVYVGDRENNRVQIFDAEGKFLTQWKESGAPYGLFLASDRLFVADGRAGWVRVLGPDGKPLGRFGE